MRVIHLWHIFWVRFGWLIWRSKCYLAWIVPRWDLFVSSLLFTDLIWLCFWWLLSPQLDCYDPWWSSQWSWWVRLGIKAAFPRHFHLCTCCLFSIWISCCTLSWGPAATSCPSRESTSHFCSFQSLFLRSTLLVQTERKEICLRHKIKRWTGSIPWWLYLFFE